MSSHKCTMGPGNGYCYFGRGKKIVYLSALIIFGVCQSKAVVVAVESSSSCRKLIRICHGHMMMTHRNQRETTRKRKRRAGPNHQLLYLSRSFALLCQKAHGLRKTALIKRFCVELNLIKWADKVEFWKRAIEVPAKVTTASAWMGREAGKTGN